MKKAGVHHSFELRCANQRNRARKRIDSRKNISQIHDRMPAILKPLYAAMARSIRYLRTEPVWPRGSLEEAELDQEPDRADDRDKPNQHPPAGFVAVVEALDMDDDGGDQGE